MSGKIGSFNRIVLAAFEICAARRLVNIWLTLACPDAKYATCPDLALIVFRNFVLHHIHADTVARI